VRVAQEARVTSAGNLKAPREQAYKAIEQANKEIQDINIAQEKTRKTIGELETKKATVTTDMNTKTDIGSFQFVAKALGTDVDTAVKYFILSLVFVFDPLAVSLVLAFNKLTEPEKENKPTLPGSIPVVNTPAVNELTKEPEVVNSNNVDDLKENRRGKIRILNPDRSITTKPA
jgi:hypothetical protein